MSICSSTPQHGRYTNSSLLQGDVKVRKCHAITILKNLYEPKIDVILTISFKITAEIEITEHMFCVLLCRRGRVSAFCKAYLRSFNHSLPWNMRLHCFFTEQLGLWGSIIFKRRCRRKFRGKGIKSKTVPQVYVISLSCGVVVRCSRFEPSRKCGGRVPYLFFLRSFFLFCFLCCCFL